MYERIRKKDQTKIYTMVKSMVKHNRKARANFSHVPKHQNQKRMNERNKKNEHTNYKITMEQTFKRKPLSE